MTYATHCTHATTCFVISALVGLSVHCCCNGVCSLCPAATHRTPNGEYNLSLLEPAVFLGQLFICWGHKSGTRVWRCQAPPFGCRGLSWRAAAACNICSAWPAGSWCHQCIHLNVHQFANDPLELSVPPNCHSTSISPPLDRNRHPHPYWWQRYSAWWRRVSLSNYIYVLMTLHACL